MSLGSFILGGLILGDMGSTHNYYMVNNKKYEEHYSYEFECNVLVPVEEVE